jgi:glutathione S-transferase
MLELYHAPLSTCSQKVRIVLAEKSVEWSGHELNLAAGDQNQPAFLKLNPNGVVPVIVHNGRTIIESSLINEYLDEVFPAPALKPKDAADRAAMRLWPKFTDESAQPAVGVITRATMYRAGQMQRPREQVLAAIDNDPKLALRALRRRLYEMGPDAPEFAVAVATMIALLDRMESALANSPWLAGPSFSLADAAAMPYVVRLDHLAQEHLWTAGKRPHLAVWYERLRARPTFKRAVADFAPPALVDPVRKIGLTVRARFE